MPFLRFYSESNAEYGNWNHSGNSMQITGEHDCLQMLQKKGNDESDSAKDIKFPLEDDMQFKRPTASRTIRAFLRAGPGKTYFDPKGTTAVVTCGGCAWPEHCHLSQSLRSISCTVFTIY